MKMLDQLEKSLLLNLLKTERDKLGQISSNRYQFDILIEWAQLLPAMVSGVPLNETNVILACDFDHNELKSYRGVQVHLSSGNSYNFYTNNFFMDLEYAHDWSSRHGLKILLHVSIKRFLALTEEGKAMFDAMGVDKDTFNHFHFASTQFVSWNSIVKRDFEDIPVGVQHDTANS